MAAYEVKSVTEDQIQDPNGGLNLVPVFDVVFTIPNRTSEFTVQVPFGKDTVKAVYDAITVKVDEVNAIYGGGTGTPGA